MLEKERFLAIKKLARDIRNDNKKLFESLNDKPANEAIKAKEEFINSTINNMGIAFSDGEQGREEKQVFRANILIPDDNDFFDTYSKDKNIRNLMNKYVVNIEDIMSKITELNLYGKYIEKFDEVKDKDLASDSSFIDEMVKISPKEAESLLDEIDNLSSVMEDLDLNKETKEEKSQVDKEPKEEKIEKQLVEKEIKEDSFDDMTDAISDFVNQYDKLNNQLEEQNKQIKDLQSEVKELTSENEKISNSQESLDKLKSENETLKKENDELNAKLMKTTQILNKIYKTISQK